MDPEVPRARAREHGWDRAAAEMVRLFESLSAERS
jgi:hypothetical protein